MKNEKKCSFVNDPCLRMIFIVIMSIISVESGLISKKNISERRGKIMVTPPWPNGQIPETTRQIREVHYNLTSHLKNFKPGQPLQRRPRRWEVHHQIPETATSITEAVAKATKAILDPYKILELVVKSIPESLRITGWYLALAVTFMWCLVVLIIGGYVTLQALRLLFGMTKYCGSCVKTSIACVYKNRKQKKVRNIPQIVKAQSTRLVSS